METKDTKTTPANQPAPAFVKPSTSAAIKVPLGKVLQSRLISRSDVADGAKGRAIPLWLSVVGINLFYSEDPKGAFLCSQEEAIRYGLSPRFYYVIAVLRANTDSKGVPIDDALKLEYLRMGSAQYEEIADSLSEIDDHTLISFTLTKKSVNTYAFVQPKISTKAIPANILERASQIRESLNEDAVFEYIIADVGRPFTQYLKALAKDGGTASPAQPKLPAPNTNFQTPDTEVDEDGDEW